MCGLVGIIINAQNGFYKKQEDVFSQLLFVDELRGADSTGIIYVEKDSSFGIMKDASPASWVGESMMLNKMTKDSLRFGKAYLGHNRKATVGKVNDDTAHPFVIDDTFAMQHNGTLYNHKQLADTLVDSEALAIHIKPHLSDDFDLPKFEEAMGKVSGAYAVVAFNQENNTVYMMRNSQRPLWIAETHDGYVYSSEAGALYWILSRNGYDVSKAKIESLPEHTLFSINLDTMKGETVKFTPKKHIPMVTTTGHGTGKTGVTTKTGTRAKTGPSEQQRTSKNEYKRLRRQFLGTRHTFFASDWVEKNFPATVEEGADIVMLFGNFDGDWAKGICHTTSCNISIEDVFGGELVDTSELTDGSYHGRIYDMEYKNGLVTFYLEDVKKILVKEGGHSKWNAFLPAIH